MMDWDKAYRDHQPEVFAYLYTRCGRSRELARDLAQDTFVRAMRYEGRFRYDDGRGVAPWLITIARNLLLDHLKSSRVVREAAVPVFYDEWTPPVPSAEDTVVPGLAAVEVMALVMGLNVRQREAMLLTVADLPDAVIARRTGCKVGAVKTLKHRARANLRRTLAGVA